MSKYTSYLCSLTVDSIKQSIIGLEGICSQRKCHRCACDVFQTCKHL